MLAFLSLIGCSQNQKSVNLQVSASFEIGTAGFTGGLIAYGEGPNGAKFAVSSGTGQSINTTIVDGAWKIYVMGWDDPNNLKFRGTKYCGMSEVNLASNDTSVNITLSATNCSGTTFETDTVPKAVLISSCGGFYSYNSDTFGDILTDEFCTTLPTSLQTSFEYYRLALPTIQGATVSPGIKSECIVAKGVDGYNRLDIPTKKFPFRVMMFRSLQDCMDPTNPRMSAFGFLNGLEAGNQPSFDQYYYSSGQNALLVLPTSMTRRGYSPFMGMIPRILCGTADCFAQPAVPTQFNVPWISDMFMSGNNDKNWDKTIIKGFRPTNVSSNTCDSPTLSLLNQSPYFSIDQCSIQNGDLRGNFARNRFTCRALTDFNNVGDLYERSGRIYQYDSYEHKIHVYSEKGVHLNAVDLSLTETQTFKSMATDSYNNLYVVISDTYIAENYRKLRKYYFSYGNYNNTPYDWNSYSYLHLQNIEKIEVTDNGNIVAAKTNSIQAFNVENMENPGTAVTISGTAPIIKKILFRNLQLYILAFDNPVSELYAVTLSGLNFNTLSTSYFTGSSDPEYASFHYTDIAGSKYFVFNPAGAAVTAPALKIFPVSNLSSPYVSIAFHSASDPDIHTGGAIIMVKNMIYKKSSTGFTARDFKPGNTPTASIISTFPTSALGEVTCSAVLTQAVTSNSPAYALNLRSSNAASLDILFDEAFRYLGRRDVDSDNTFYYFQSLAEDNKSEGNNAGGILGHAEQMLGPDGVGGVLNGLYPGKSCNEIVALIPDTGITKTLNLFDIIDGTTQALSMFLSKNVMNEEMYDFVNFPDDSSDKYDLAVTASLVGSPDKMKIQLVCGKKRGSLEEMGYKASEIESRNRLLWNIGADNSYYEQYNLEDYKDYNSYWTTRASLTRLVKTKIVINSVPTYRIDTRHLEINRYNTSTPTIEGSVVEVFRANSSGEKLMTTKVSTGNIFKSLWDSPAVTLIEQDTLSSIISTYSIKTILNSASSPTHFYPELCMNTIDTDPTASGTGGCTNPDWIPSVSSSPSLTSNPFMANVRSLVDLNNETTDPNNLTSSMNSEFSEVFELEH